jgi:hypothetical protein
MRIDAPLDTSNQLMVELARKVKIYGHVVKDRIDTACGLIKGKALEDTIIDYPYKSKILPRAYEYRRLFYLNKSILTVA